MNLPSDFTEYTRQLMGDDMYGRLAEALDSPDVPASMRINPFKACGHDVDERLLCQAVPWCPSTGRYLGARPNFTFDPLFHAGAYYVQEASSMFVDYVVRQLVGRPVTMLDLCAAPGGKSTALRAALSEGSLLFSNEPMRQRAQVLAENMQKFGHEDVVVTNNYPRDYRKSRLMFDAILADVPCSGEGMFRKDDGARAEWSLQNVDNCWHLQREIVEDVWQCLRPGGLLIYSTCTFNAHEDEENVMWIASELGADIVELPVDTEWGIVPSLVGGIPAYRFLPGFTRGEGLFLAVLRKHGGDDNDASGVEIVEQANAVATQSKKVKKDRRRVQTAQKEGKAKMQPAVTIPLRGASNYVLRKVADTLTAVPERWSKVFDTAASSLRIIHAGVGLGVEKGRDVIPAQSLALSRQLADDAYPRVEVGYADAVSYLRKEAVALPGDTPRGFVLLTYHGLPLGFEKNIGNRANNLYPQEWRIKSSHVPDEACRIMNM